MSEWAAVHLYYHEDLDRLLTELLMPLVRDLKQTGELRQWFFLRYWEGGNHLRVRLSTASARQTRTMIGQVRCLAEDFMRRRPSIRSLPDDQYHRLASVFATAEGISRVPAQLPDNTVRIADYRPEHERYGHGRVLRAVEDHFQTSSEIALRLVAARTGEPERLTAGFDFLLRAWQTAIPEPDRLESFADLLFEAWRRRLGPRIAPEREQQFAVRYEAQKDRLQARLTAEPNPVTAIWIRSLRAVVAEIGPAITDLGFRPQPRPGWDELIDQPATDTGVMAVLDLCAHLVCNRLGINTVQESYLRFVAARLIRDLADPTVRTTDDQTPTLQDAL